MRCSPCHGSHGQVQKYLDGRLSEGKARAFQRHLAHCPACANLLSATSQLLKEARVLEMPEPSELEWKRIEVSLLHRVEDAGREGWSLRGLFAPRWWAVSWQTALASLAALVAVGLFALLGLPQPAPSRPDRAAPVIISPPLVVEAIPEKVPPLVREQALALPTFASGPVMGGKRETAQPLPMDGLITEGWALSTGPEGKLSVEINEGTGFSLGPNSAVKLEVLRPKEVKLRLLRGWVTAEVAPLTEKKSFEIVTVYHIVSVVGTSFSVFTDSHLDRVDVSRGRVRILDLDRSHFVEIPAGQRFSVESMAPVAQGVMEVAQDLVAQEVHLLPLPQGGMEALSKAGTLNVTSDPPGFDVRVGGHLLGLTPLAIRKPPGKYRVQVAQEGQVFRDASVDVLAESVASYSFTVPRSAKPEAGPRDHRQRRLDQAQTEDAIARVFNKNLFRLRKCYERGLKRNPKLEGDIVIRMTIGTSGKVVDASVDSSTLSGMRMSDCVIKTLQKMSFPPPASKEVTVIFPLVFEPERK